MRTPHLIYQPIKPRTARLTLFVTIFLFLLPISSAQQLPNRVNPQIVAPGSPSYSLPEMESLAVKMAAEISKRHLRSMAVFGVAGPSGNVTELGAGLGDYFSQLLAAYTPETRVLDRAELKEILHHERLARTELERGVLAAWVAHKAHSSGFITVSMRWIGTNKVEIGAYLFETSDFRPLSRIGLRVEAILNKSQIIAANVIVPRTLNPLPQYPLSELQHNGAFPPLAQGSLSWAKDAGLKKMQSGLQITVTPEGLATDIEVVKPGGFDIDEAAVKQVLNKKYKSPTTIDGHFISVQVDLTWYYNLR